MAGHAVSSALKRGHPHLHILAVNGDGVADDSHVDHEAVPWADGPRLQRTSCAGTRHKPLEHCVDYRLQKSQVGKLREALRARWWHTGREGKGLRGLAMGGERD